MTGRARILDLMARKAAAELAADRLVLVRAVRRMAEAERMADRLGALLAERPALPGGALVADLRLSRRMGAEIAAARDQQSAAAAALHAEVATRQEAIGRKDRRRERIAEAARAAHLAETEAQEAVAGAAQPPRRPSSR